MPFLPRETLDFPRSWLLPVLRDNVQGARLGFFTSYFLPLAATLKSRGEENSMVGVSAVRGVLWDLSSLPWGGARLCNICSAHLLFLFCSPGVYPGWEECGGQDLRHIAVAGNKEPSHSVRLVPGWGAVTGAKAVASHLFLCLPGLDSAAWLLHPSHRRGGSLQGAGPHPGHGHQRAPRPPPHCVPGLAHPHPQRLRDRLGWKQTLVVGPCHLWEGRC